MDALTHLRGSDQAASSVHVGMQTCVQMTVEPEYLPLEAPICCNACAFLANVRQVLLLCHQLVPTCVMRLEAAAWLMTIAKASRKAHIH